MIIFLFLIPRCLGLVEFFDCHQHEFWNSFRYLVSEAIESHNPGIFISSELVSTSSFIINDLREYIDLFSSDDGTVSEGAWLSIAKLNGYGDQLGDFCPYGVVTALYVTASALFHTGLGHTRYLQAAMNILGDATKRNLDFMEDSEWGVRSLDLIVNLNEPSRFIYPWEVREKYRLSQTHSASPSDPLLERLVARNAGAFHSGIAVWEIGVHASLSAESLTMLSLSGKLKSHRRLIQRQYPKVLQKSICEEMYQVAGFCDSVTDDLTKFWEQVLPLSDTSSDPPADDIGKITAAFKAIYDIHVAAHQDRPDVIVCTVPWICVVAAELDVSLIGYLGHPIPFMVRRDKHQEFLHAFKAIAIRPNVRFIVTDPFLQMQYEYQIGIQFPYIRTTGLYMNTHADTDQPSANEVLVFDRPYDMALMASIQSVLNVLFPSRNPLKPQIDDFVREAFSDSYPLKFITRNSLKDKSYKALAKFRRVVLYPYDMDLVSFYELYFSGVTIWMPSSLEKYVFYQNHIKYDERIHEDASVWSARSQYSALNESNADVAMTQLRFADYFNFPGVRTFENISDLVYKIRYDVEPTDPRQTAFTNEAIQQALIAWRAILSDVLSILD